MTSTPFDLLREKRQELGLPDPVEASRQSRRNLLKGGVIGGAMVAVALGVVALVALRAGMVAGQLDRFATLAADAEQYETRLRADQAKLKRLESVTKALVDGLLGVRSGSALLRDLQLRVPQGIQLTEAKEQDDGKTLLLKGIARHRQPFGLINALQLELERSPLIDPNGVTLRRASRSEAAPSRDVSFELNLRFRPAIDPAGEEQILAQLGADGLAQRLVLLQREGLLP
jgi:type IV pilus assembly protein PilN